MAGAPEIRAGREDQALDGLWLDTDVVTETGDWSALGNPDAAVLKAARAVARHPRFQGRPSASVCFALSDDATVQTLNRTYRNMDKPTNVLSFPAPDGIQAQDQPEALGDVVFAAETIVREAADLAIAPTHHLQHLAVHGLLHLLGFDHQTEEEAGEMEGLEVEILASLGISNPYAEEKAAEPLRERLA